MENHQKRPPRYRQGNKVPENIYDMQAQPWKPIMIAPSPYLAEHYVKVMNLGEDALKDLEADT